VNSLRILVAIANYGQGSRQYLDRVIQEYRSMPWHVDIVVLSNIPKDLGPGVEVVVGLPIRNPWSLPFGHQKIFADRADRYDLFVYSEDDGLITSRNIEAFLDATNELHQDELAGFLRIEKYPNGDWSFPDVHGPFSWEPASLCTRGKYRCAYFSNEHSACYMLTREQLRRAIASGGYLVPPHEGAYDMLVSAATDVYTQCGFRKLICVSHLEDFCVHHLPNKYVGRMGIDGTHVREQLAALMRQGRAPGGNGWVKSKTQMRRIRWSRENYAKANRDALDALPPNVKSVLSIGCDFGSTERELVARGVRVVGIPTDPIAASSATAGGVEIVEGSFDEAIAALNGSRFDAVLCLDLLHLTPDPLRVFRSARSLLRDGGTFIASVPHTGNLKTRVRRLLGKPGYRDVGNYQKIGVHWFTERAIRRMYDGCGLNVVRVKRTISKKSQQLNRAALGLGERLLASEFLVVGMARA
jgi:SAM-dependent methyltransferase